MSTIEVKEQIARSRSEWRHDLIITHTPHGTTQLTRVLLDHAALNGLLCRQRSLGLTLLVLHHLSSWEGSLYNVSQQNVHP